MKTLRASGPRLSRYVVPGFLALGLLFTSAGWYRAATAGSDVPFDSCRLENHTLILEYSYGVNYGVSPTFDMVQGEAVVALHIEVDDGPAPAVALHGEARFQVSGDPSVVRYPDGEELACSPS